MAEAHGYCDARFAAVRAAFLDNFEQRGEVGAAIAVYHEGRLVVDLWGGHRDLARTQPWERDTLACGFSLGKTLAAECVTILLEQRRIDLDKPVAHYWPEFAASGKQDITVRMVLCHKSGMSAIRQPLPFWASSQWEVMTRALAEEAPWWTPGEKHGYAVNTYGHLVGEIVRRVSGLPFGEFLRRELAGPLELDLHCGTTAREDARLANVIQPNPFKMPKVVPAQRELLEKAYFNPPTIGGTRGLCPPEQAPMEEVPANRREWRQGAHPGNNMVMTARALAAYCDMHARRGVTSSGHRFLSEEVIAETTREHARGPDYVLILPTCFSLAFKRWQRERRIGPNPERSYFANGFGGSIALVDPDARLALAYVMSSLMARSFLTERNSPLIEAAYASIA